MEQHHIVGGTRFGLDRSKGPSHFKMAMFEFIIGWHRSRTFKPQISVILGVDSSAALFTNLSTTFMCICVKECATFGGFLASYIDNMATN